MIRRSPALLPGILILTILILSMTASKGSAFEAYPLWYESIRTRAMGGVSIALPEEEQALYSNPAALGLRETSAYSFINAGAEINRDFRNVKDETDRLSDADTAEGRGFNNNVLSRVMGNTARGQAHNLAYYLGSKGFGAGILAQGLVEIEAVRPTNPKVRTRQVSDIVLSGSFARPIPGSRIVFNDKARGWWGGTAKILTRSYLSAEFDPRDFAGLSESDLTDRRHNGTTMDADFGALYSLDNRWWQTLGLTVGNVFETEIDPQVGNLQRWIAVGTSIRPLSGPANRKQKLVLAADLWDVTGDGTFWHKLRLGMEARPRPWLRLLFGLRSGYPSAGFSTVFNNVSCHVSTYSEERGPRVGDREDRRYALGLNIHF
jgi:hypothetical protein